MKTIRVRIAVGVTPNGSYCAHGWGVRGESHTDREEKAIMDIATEVYESDEPSDFVSEFWIEADVPVPEATVIEGTVSAALTAAKE
jgi:hypothetical protein